MTRTFVWHVECAGTWPSCSSATRFADRGGLCAIADFNLATGDSVYYAHAGMPLIMTQAQGPGHIAFSCDAPGEMISVPIHPGQTIGVKEHLFLAATNTAGYDWFQTNIWFRSKSADDTETHYPVGMFMDRFSSVRPSNPTALSGGQALAAQFLRQWKRVPGFSVGDRGATGICGCAWLVRGV